MSTATLVETRPVTTPRKKRRLTRSVLPVLVALAGGLGLWYAVTYLVLSEQRRFLLPPPHEVVRVAFGDPVHLQPKLEALALTTRVALTGLGIAVVLGILTAVLMSQADFLERAIFPYAVIIQTVPILAIVPLIGLWFQFGFTSRVIVCVIIALFPMISNTLFGIHSADRDAHDLFTLNKASRWQRLVLLQLPAAVPSIFTGLRTSAGLAVIGAVVGDMFFRQGEPGIGGLLDTYRSRLQSEDLIGAIFLASFLGVAIFAVFTALDRAVVGRWYGTSR
ncbi:ABC transporter permease [Cryptosporangium phraense]|uniref:ABC transporter permease n=1 Tax=Cryptosporangium phraense TaxID=2593070 RepID=A0A545B0B5_9ACTN|nr:ABC transporter permease [Cryptosporangium phraense]TQS47026.1 ABC transporter permease [Cryptosporangium phraense]